MGLKDALADKAAADTRHKPRASETDTADVAFRVEQAIFLLRRGREVAIRDNEHTLVFSAVEHLGADALSCLPPGPRHLLLSRERAHVLGHDVKSPAADVCLPAATSPEHMRVLVGLIDPTQPYLGSHTCEANSERAASAALELSRQAASLPALLLRRESTERHDCVITVDDVEVYRNVRGRLLECAARADVQLARAARTEFLVYPERFGNAQHVAVIVGIPDFDGPVSVRLHSACFTGDLFGSLRCDCGEQLAGAVEHMANTGGGVILYLDQEGRGIGLANKLRAYRMQADGHDTIDADQHLGFGPDGRDFTPALTILTDLGISQVRLLTNNPAKIAALESDGIRVVEQLPLCGTINAHNASYLHTKRDRGGHFASVAEGAMHDG